MSIEEVGIENITLEIDSLGVRYHDFIMFMRHQSWFEWKRESIKVKITATKEMWMISTQYVLSFQRPLIMIVILIILYVNNIMMSPTMHMYPFTNRYTLYGDEEFITLEVLF